MRATTAARVRFVGGPLHNVTPLLRAVTPAVLALACPSGIAIVPEALYARSRPGAWIYHLIGFDGFRCPRQSAEDSWWGEEADLQQAKGGLAFVEYVLAEEFQQLPDCRTNLGDLIGWQLDDAELLARGLAHTGGHVSRWAF